MPLTKAEKERVRYHLGYLNISQGAALSLGVPSASQTQFILESAMNDLLPEGEPGVRRCIQELDCIEDQNSTFRSSLEIIRSGSTHIRGSGAFDELERQYSRWAQKLADTLGSPLNPFSSHHSAIGTIGGGVVEPQ